VDERLAAEVLAALEEDVPEGVVLWRGEDLGGNDVDLVALEGHGPAVARVLRAAGLAPAPQEPGRVLWRRLPGETVVVDVLAPHAWPARYPALDGVARRAVIGALGLPVASAGDRVLMHAAEAVAGWPADKTGRRLRAAQDELGAGASVATAVGAEAGLEPLARVAGRVASGAGSALGWRPSLAAGVRSRQARAALRERLAAGLGLAVRAPLPRTAGGGRGRLIALSGMDGAGKSTAALTLLEAMDEAGRPAVVHWTRLAGELGPLDRLARLVRRVLRRARPLADPEGRASWDGSAVEEERGGIVAAVWVLAVAAAAVAGARRTGRIRRRGLTVICDRWLADALVDLRVRYGHQPAAEWLLRRGFPRADVAVLLEVAPAAAARRKPGDQSEAVLRAMAGRYADVGEALALPRVDAGAPADDVASRLRAVTLGG
jgi:thymidylate kinase